MDERVDISHFSLLDFPLTGKDRFSIKSEIISLMCASVCICTWLHFDMIRKYFKGFHRQYNYNVAVCLFVCLIIHMCTLHV